MLGGGSESGRTVPGEEAQGRDGPGCAAVTSIPHLGGLKYKGYFFIRPGWEGVSASWGVSGPREQPFGNDGFVSL